ncbi:MAG: AMP-binding enzyme [Myxococcales bacterium]|nr:AMP-binding enzyme [Myxococcales bacterium]
MLSFIAERAAEDAPALVRPDGAQMTYGTLAMAAAAVRQAVEARVGDVAGRVVGVAVDDMAGFVASVLGLLEAGAVIMPLEPARGIEALEIEAAEARAVAVIVGDAAEDRLDVIAGDATRRLLAPEACLLLEAPTAGGGEGGGAGARSRRAMHSRQSLGLGVDAIVAQLGLAAGARVPLLGTPTEMLITATLPTLRAGGTLLALHGVRAVDQASAMARLGATLLTGAAATLIPIAAAATSSTISAARSAGVHLKRVVVVGAIEPDDAALLRRAFGGARVERACDAPETLRIAAGQTEPLQPLAGVRVHASGAALEVHSPTLMMGYLDDPEATRVAFVARDDVRWIRTAIPPGLVAH